MSERFVFDTNVLIAASASAAQATLVTPSRRPFLRLANALVPYSKP